MRHVLVAGERSRAFFCAEVSTTLVGNDTLLSCREALLRWKRTLPQLQEVYRSIAVRGFPNCPKLDNLRQVALDANSQRCPFRGHTSASWEGFFLRAGDATERRSSWAKLQSVCPPYTLGIVAIEASLQ